MPLRSFPDGLLQRAANSVFTAQSRWLAAKPAMQAVRRGDPQSPQSQARVGELRRWVQEQEREPPWPNLRYVGRRKYLAPNVARAPQTETCSTESLSSIPQYRQAFL